MVSPVENSDIGGLRGRASSGRRAAERAQSIVEGVKSAFQQANWWLDPRLVSLKNLTNFLNENGVRSPRGDALTPTAVDRACQRAGYDWRAMRQMMTRSRISLGHAAILLDTSKIEQAASDKTLLSRRTLKRERVNERFHDLLKKID